MEETPYLDTIQKVLQLDGFVSKEKPPSILAKYAHLFFIKSQAHLLFPITLGIIVLWNLIRHNQVNVILVTLNN